MKSVPSLADINQIMPNNNECVSFLQERNVFYTELACEVCGELMKRTPNQLTFRCTKIMCTAYTKRISMRKGTFFFGSKLSCLDIIRVAHLWISKVTVESAILLSGHSSATICTFYQHFRNLVTSSLSEVDQIIGGPGIDVEIDETKLGKRKYHRGHRVEGVWVLVGIERTLESKIFLVQVPERSKETLQNIISQHVIEGSNIITDMWRGYQNIEERGYTHQTVNHSRHFVDPSSGACTNTAEGLNSGLKRRIAIRNRTEDKIAGHLAEYIWRRQNKENLFDSFISALKDIHYELE